MHNFSQKAPQPSEIHHHRALDRQAQLTKPPGSLGRLEDLAVALAAMQGRDHPGVERTCMVIFAADHGVAAEGISAFPQAVTVEMIRNFAAGGAAICALCREQDIPLRVINMGTAFDATAIAGVEHINIAPGSANFCKEPALNEQQLQQAMGAGARVVEAEQDIQLFMAGEMGIGNTTAASALLCALLKQQPATLAGPGTGLDDAGIQHKAQIIQAALNLHHDTLDQPLEVLRRLGGLEIAALVGAYIRAAQLGIPVLVDGFICGAAAVTAMAINPSVKPWLLLSHHSAEPGYGALLEHFAYPPLLDLNLRLGEGSGAATAYPLLKLACSLHRQMATFADAGVSNNSDGHG